MRVPLWAIPGLAAIVLTTASVSAAEGTFSSSTVALPREVQLSVPASGAAVPGSPPTTTTLLPDGSGPVDQVVAPSRPVISQTGSSRAAGGLTPEGSGVASPTGASAPAAEPGEGIGTGQSAPPQSTPAPTTTTPVTGTGALPPTTSTTTIPPTTASTTTTTTRPRRDDGGDDGGDR